MPNIRAVPNYNNTKELSDIVQNLRAKHGTFGGRRIEYTDKTNHYVFKMDQLVQNVLVYANENTDKTNHYVFKMDQLVQNVLVYANENTDVKEEMYRILSALEVKDAELKKPENIATSGWKGFKRAMTRITSRLGRLVCKRDQLIADTKAWISLLIQGDIQRGTTNASEQDVQEFVQKLKEFCAGMKVEELQEALERRITKIHRKEVRDLIGKKPCDFMAIEKAIQKLPEGSDPRSTCRAQLAMLKDEEADTLRQIDDMSAFLTKREWSCQAEYNPFSVNIYQWPLDGITLRIRTAAQKVQDENREQLNYFHQQYDLFPIIIAAHFRKQDYPTNISEANKEIEAITEMLNKNPGPKTRELLDKSLAFYKEKEAAFSDEISGITHRVENNESFSKSDFLPLTRAAMYYEAVDDKDRLAQIQTVREGLEAAYKVRDALMLKLEENLNNIKTPLHTEETLQAEIKGMPEGAAKQEVVEKLGEFQRKKAELDHFQKVYQEILDAPSFEALENAQPVAANYVSQLETAKATAGKRLLDQLFLEKKKQFGQLIESDAFEDEFELFFSGTDAFRLIDSHLKSQFNELMVAYTNLQMVRKFFEDPQIELKFTSFVNYDFPKLLNTIFLLEHADYSHRQFYYASEDEMKILTEEQQQLVLGRFYMRRLQGASVNLRMEQLQLCIKCGIAFCADYSTKKNTEAFRAFTDPAFQSRLLKFWKGPFEKASAEDIAVIETALKELTFHSHLKKSLEFILSMQKLGMHFSENHDFGKDLDAVLSFGKARDAWTDFKREPRNKDEILFDSIFTLHKREKLTIENAQYEEFFASAKQNKDCIERSTNTEQAVKDIALELNYTLAAMMHPVELETPLEEETMTQAAWLIPQMKGFLFNVQNEIGSELNNQMQENLRALEAVLDAFATHAELNPALFATMKTYSAIVQAFFGTNINYNFVYKYLYVPVKPAIVKYSAEVKKQVSEHELSIDPTCTMTLLQRLVWKLKKFLKKLGLKATKQEIQRFEYTIRSYERNRQELAKECQREMQYIERNAKERKRMEEKLSIKEEVVEQHKEKREERMVMRY